MCDADSTAPECAGSWGAPFKIPVMAINAVMLPTGKVMWWAYPTNPHPTFGDANAENTAQAWLWDPATGKTKRVDPPLWRDPADGQLKPANIWCSGQSLLQDGRVVVAGGNLSYYNPAEGRNEYAGLNAVFTFNPWNERWTRQPDMEHGRWYPSQVLLPDGRTLILSGYDEGGEGVTNKDIEIFTASSDLDGVGAVDPLNEGMPRGADGAPDDGGLYPHTFVMPSGRVMLAGPAGGDSWLLHDPGVGNVLDWTDFDGTQQRFWGSAVLLPDGQGSTRVQQIGGSDRTISRLSMPTTATIDEADLDAGWQAGASMQVGRGHHNTVLLPDGSMVTVGGGVGLGDDFDLWQGDEDPNEEDGVRKRVELYDPVADEWRLGAAQAEYRAYHSTAILLPDGRVISAGDDYNGGIDRDTAEIYSPPYLHYGPGSRPTITGAPKTVAYGTTFDVDYQGPEVTRAALVAPGATTHAVDMNQRWVPLELDPSSGPESVTLHAPPGNDADPPGKNIAPPGWYMLFLLSADGVPSVASWVRVDETPPAPGTIAIRQVSSEPGAKFDFSGAPFVDFALSNGQERSKTVVAAEYEIAQAVEPGFALTGVSCDDGNSAGSVADRRATVRVEAGESVRCTFTSKPVAGPPTPDPDPPRLDPPSTDEPPQDRTAPMIVFNRKRGLDLRRKLLRGRTSDKSGIRRVTVALGARRGKRCRWWSKRARRLGGIRSCKRPAFIRAKLKRSGGGVVWKASLAARPRAGRYLVVVRSWDRKGNLKQLRRSPVLVRRSR